jgi:hypothetical protein
VNVGSEIYICLIRTFKDACIAKKRGPATSPDYRHPLHIVYFLAESLFREHLGRGVDDVAKV